MSSSQRSSTPVSPQEQKQEPASLADEGRSDDLNSATDPASLPRAPRQEALDKFSFSTAGSGDDQPMFAPLSEIRFAPRPAALEIPATTQSNETTPTQAMLDHTAGLTASPTSLDGMSEFDEDHHVSKPSFDSDFVLFPSRKHLEEDTSEHVNGYNSSVGAPTDYLTRRSGHREPVSMGNSESTGYAPGSAVSGQSVNREQASSSQLQTSSGEDFLRDLPKVSPEPTEEE
jgi:hypothetical protein